MKCSVIIPTYNEESNIESLLKQLKGYDVIVVDAGSKDNTVKSAKKHAKVIKSKIKNRAHQLNLGAKHAKGDVLIFIHADSILPNNWCRIIHAKVSKKCPWGGFHIRFNSQNPLFRLIEFRSNQIRVNMFKVFFGDQGIFAKKELFHKVGGFPEVPILEDLLFTKRMRHIAKPIIIKKPIITSARRFQANGIFKTYFAMGMVMLFYHLRVPLPTIKSFYSKLQRAYRYLQTL